MNDITHQLSAELASMLEAREAVRPKAYDNLRDIHNRVVIALSQMKVPPAISTYDKHGEQAWWLRDVAKYQREVWNIIRPLYEHCRDDAVGVCSARCDSVDFLEGAVTDFTGCMVSRAEELEEGQD